MRMIANGLMFDGHDTGRAELLAQARAYLIGQGVHPLDADDQLADRQGLIARAWWGGDEVGFVSPEHPDAQPVTVVHCSVPA